MNVELIEAPSVGQTVTVYTPTGATTGVVKSFDGGSWDDTETEYQHGSLVLLLPEGGESLVNVCKDEFFAINKTG